MAGPGKPGRPKKPTPEWKYKLSKDVEDVGREVIAELHPALSRAVIKWGFIESQKTGFGKVAKVGEMQAVMLERAVHFLVVVDAKKWEAWAPEHRRAALSILLCSCDFDEMRARIVTPDLRIHIKALADGLYPPEIEDMLKQAQPHLPGLVKAKPKQAAKAALTTAPAIPNQ